MLDAQKSPAEAGMPNISRQIWDMKYRLKDAEKQPVDLTVDISEKDGKRTWMRAYGHYRQSYRKSDHGWQIVEHRLTRLLVENGVDEIVSGWG